MHLNYGDLDAEAKFAYAEGAPAVVTIPAEENQHWVIDWITWSYDIESPIGTLRVEIGGEVVWEVDIVVGGPGHIEFHKVPLYEYVLNQEVKVTLTDGGGVGKLNVRYR